uniref:Uncharacterized protein n=1 Tax=Anguilla anguilla TaxID=7936 RepID=A0A0E9QEY5_ANGAN
MREVAIFISMHQGCVCTGSVFSVRNSLLNRPCWNFLISAPYLGCIMVIQCHSPGFGPCCAILETEYRTFDPHWSFSGPGLLQRRSYGVRS